MDEIELSSIKNQIATFWDKYVECKKEYDTIAEEYNASRINALKENSDEMFVDFNINVVTTKIKLDNALNNWKIFGYKDQVEMLWNVINQNKTETAIPNEATTESTAKYTEEDENNLKRLWPTYLQKKEVYDAAVKNMETVKTKAATMQSSEAIHDYAINATNYKSQVETALQDWMITGNKNEVELLLKKGISLTNKNSEL
jgi:hypothetical protein